MAARSLVQVCPYAYSAAPGGPLVAVTARAGRNAAAVLEAARNERAPVGAVAEPLRLDAPWQERWPLVAAVPVSCQAEAVRRESASGELAAMVSCPATALRDGPVPDRRPNA